MKSVRSFLNTLLGLIFFLIIALLAWLILVPHVPALTVVEDNLRCVAGVPAADSDCVQSMIADLRDQKAQIEAERDDIAEMFTRGERVYEQGKVLRDGLYVAVGTIYDDPDTKTGVRHASCHAVLDLVGFDPRVLLATLDAGGRITPVPVSTEDALELDLSAAEIADARAACPFPSMS